MVYRSPGADIEAIVDAPGTPLLSVGPGTGQALLTDVESHPPVALLARPFAALAGVRIDPAQVSRQRTTRLPGLAVLDLATGDLRRLSLPTGANLGAPSWAPDGNRFAFTVDRPGGVQLWVGEAATATAGPVPDLWLNDILTGGQLGGAKPFRWCRDGAGLLLLTVPPGGRPPADQPALPAAPQVEEAVGKRTQMATFQDLLRTEVDAAWFAELARSVPARLDVGSGQVQRLGEADLYTGLEDSPDGRRLLVGRLRRPFSFRVPYPYFSRTVEVWAADGSDQLTIAELDVSDQVPRHGVPVGPRQAGWVESLPATLGWLEALDGGDPVAPADFRDRLVCRSFGVSSADEAREVGRFPGRCRGWWDLPGAGELLALEHDRDRRWLTVRRVDVAAGGPGQVVFDYSENDAYADPGQPIVVLRPDGRRVADSVDGRLLLSGDGATPTGDRPFLDLLDLDSAATERVFQSPADCQERVVAVRGGTELVVVRQGPEDVPDLFCVEPGGARRRLTQFPHPHPQLSGMGKRLVVHERPDGVALSGMLHLPPGHDPDRDGRLPLVLWAYPLDYSDGSTAGQVRGSAVTFTRLHPLRPVYFVLRGYAVLENATMPVIGDPETMNDTYIEQTVAAAKAHIDFLDREGLIDPTRVIVGGHSYGGFMTANLLAHSDLFAAGIARSGAYNRTLTPFGFQTERRMFWEAPEVYDRVSPFRYADRITDPLLLVHGAADNNPGTFTLQSERLFQALAGTGGTARLVLLPHEGHGYQARESVLHLLAEQFDWAERWAPALVPAGSGRGS